MSHRHAVKFKSFDEVYGKNTINENEPPASAFQTISDSLRHIYRDALDKKHNDIRRAMPEFYDEAYYYMKENRMNVRFVNRGSSRAVYALADGTVVKIAFNEIGIAQNKHEAMICMKPQMKHSFFPDFYGADEHNWLSLNCEMCSPILDSDFIEMTGGTLYDVMNVTDFIIKHRVEDFEFSKVYEHFSVVMKDRRAAKFTETLMADKTQAAHALKSLIEFYRKCGTYELCIGDLMSLSNWGLTMRDNEKVAVVIDAGLSKDIADEFYRRRRNT